MEKGHSIQRTSSMMNNPSRLPSRHEKGRTASSSKSIDDDRPDLIIQQSMDQPAVRNVFSLLEKFDKWDMSELLTARDRHWLLTNGDIYKVVLLSLNSFLHLSNLTFLGAN